MIEVVLLLVALGGFVETAKRRGVRAWPFITAGAAGWLIAGIVGGMVVGQGPHLFFSWGWVGLAYFSIFLIGGGGRRLEERWQCPDCRAFNSPSTLVCLCGHHASGEAEDALA